MRRPGFRRCPTCEGERMVPVERERFVATGPGSGRVVLTVVQVACPNPQCDDGEIRVCHQCSEEMPEGETADVCSPCVEANKEEMQGVQP